MMQDETGRLALPLLVAGQAQKEVFHNEALALLDIVVQASVVAVGVDMPPVEAVAGQCWIVGDSPTGDWAGHGGAIAGATGNGWRFAGPVEGMAAWDRTSGAVVRYGAGGWAVGTVSASGIVVAGDQVVGARRAAIADPAGGAVVDAEARNSVLAMLSALRAHGLIAP